jgi:hypothetical protein
VCVYSPGTNALLQPKVKGGNEETSFIKNYKNSSINITLILDLCDFYF